MEAAEDKQKKRGWRETIFFSLSLSTLLIFAWTLFLWDREMWESLLFIREEFGMDRKWMGFNEVDVVDAPSFLLFLANGQLLLQVLTVLHADR